jgi:hypothetical protein
MRNKIIQLHIGGLHPIALCGVIRLKIQMSLYKIYCYKLTFRAIFFMQNVHFIVIASKQYTNKINPS